MTWRATIYTTTSDYINVYRPPSQFHRYIGSAYLPSPYFWFSNTSPPCTLTYARGGQSSPVYLFEAPNYSAMIIDGTINFPQAGTYTITAYFDDFLEVWIDDTPVFQHYVGRSCGAYTQTFTVSIPSPGPRRVRFYYGQCVTESRLLLSASLPDNSTRCPFL